VARRVEVGLLEEILVTSLGLEESSLTFARRRLSDGDAVLAQCSAHGRPQLATLRHQGRWWLDLHEPSRPVAPGQSVVMYRVDDPTVVEGAAIVTNS